MVGKNGFPVTPEWRGEARPSPFDPPPPVKVEPSEALVLALTKLDGLGEN